MEIIHAKKINTHGGSIRVYAARKKRFKINHSVRKILSYEKNFLNWKTFNSFKKNIVDSKLKLYKILNKLDSREDKVTKALGEIVNNNMPLKGSTKVSLAMQKQGSLRSMVVEMTGISTNSLEFKSGLKKIIIKKYCVPVRYEFGTRLDQQITEQHTGGSGAPPTFRKNLCH